jgi:inosine-uridine nucleoside N-ribohydrolase
MKKIIIDTDIGDDIDDALAIALALNSPELDIVGITTVFRNTTLRTKLAIKLLEVFDREDIPVVKGIEKPIINDWDKNLIPPQSEILKEEITLNTSIDAVDFIIDRLMNSEEKITLITIGPLTNIAMALIKEPKIKDKTEIFMMGGMYSRAIPEWNISCDPEAARVVFDSGIPITMVGLDVTLRCNLEGKDLDSIRSFGNIRTDFLYELLTIWQGNSQRLPILHDPLAVASFIDESLVKKEKMWVRIETRGEFTRGVIVADDRDSRKRDSNVNVCIDVDRERFISFFLDRILK